MSQFEARRSVSHSDQVISSPLLSLLITVLFENYKLYLDHANEVAISQISVDQNTSRVDTSFDLSPFNNVSLDHGANYVFSVRFETDNLLFNMELVSIIKLNKIKID